MSGPSWNPTDSYILAAGLFVTSSLRLTVSSYLGASLSSSLRHSRPKPRPSMVGHRRRLVEHHLPMPPRLDAVLPQHRLPRPEPNVIPPPRHRPARLRDDVALLRQPAEHHVVRPAVRNARRHL